MGMRMREKTLCEGCSFFDGQYCWKYHRVVRTLRTGCVGFLSKENVRLTNWLDGHFVTKIAPLRGKMSLGEEVKNKMGLHKLGAGQFLTSDDVEDGMVVTVVDKPYFKKGKFRDEQPVIPVRLPDGEQKLWSCNVTTWDRLFDVFGEDPEDYLGAQVEIMVREENVRGSMKKVMYGKAVEPLKKIGKKRSRKERLEDRIRTALQGKSAEELEGLAEALEEEKPGE